MAHTPIHHLAKMMKLLIEVDQPQVQEIHLCYAARQHCNNKQPNLNLQNSTITYQMISRLEFILK